jgi:hypothetical protein
MSNIWSSDCRPFWPLPHLRAAHRHVDALQRRSEANKLTASRRTISRPPGAALPDVRRHGPSGVPGGRRRRADSPGEEGQWPVGGGRPWNRTRKRYDRQGTLVEEPALEQAEQQCLADEDARTRRRERDRERRADTAAGLQAAMVKAITLAVVASVRHEDTAYDELLMSGVAREDAREQIKDTIASVLGTWAQDDPSPVRQQGR